jgi:predicted DCC family thiol-disulfide oxidoreductase YuxK
MRHVNAMSVMSHREYGLEYIGSVWLVTDQGRLEGARAVAKILKMARGKTYNVVGVVIDLPILRTLAAGVYYLIARNRRHLSRLFRMKACALPGAPR